MLLCKVRALPARGRLSASHSGGAQSCGSGLGAARASLRRAFDPGRPAASRATVSRMRLLRSRLSSSVSAFSRAILSHRAANEASRASPMRRAASSRSSAAPSPVAAARMRRDRAFSKSSKNSSKRACAAMGCSSSERVCTARQSTLGSRESSFATRACSSMPPEPRSASRWPALPSARRSSGAHSAASGGRRRGGRERLRGGGAQRLIIERLQGERAAARADGRHADVPVPTTRAGTPSASAAPPGISGARWRR